MCRLFGLTAGTVRVRATFWLLDAPDSLRVQSHRNPDGAGIGLFGTDGEPALDKQPEAAFGDRQFTHEARTATSSAFVAHVRYATTGARTVANTHPFAMARRIMAHNGGFSDLAQLEARLGSYMDLVHGETDSERYFALITKETDEHDGDVGAGIVAAARWIGANLPVSSLNTIVARPGELWALRYPDQHALHILERRGSAGGAAGSGQGPADGAGQGSAGGAGRSRRDPDGLHVRSATSSVHVAGPDDTDSVLIASEALDGETGWRMLAPGELVHVRPGLSVRSEVAITEAPAHLVPLPADNPNIDT